MTMINMIATDLFESYSSVTALIDHTRDTDAGSIVDITDMDVPYHVLMTYVFPHVVISLIERIVAEVPTNSIDNVMIRLNDEVNRICYIDPDNDEWSSTKMGRLTLTIEFYVVLEIYTNGWPSGDLNYTTLYEVINKVLTEHDIAKIIDEDDEDEIVRLHESDEIDDEPDLH